MVLLYNGKRVYTNVLDEKENKETMDRIDIAIIGGGVVGLAAASVVSERGRDVYIFEKNSSFGQETSSRNSEVIHSGIYYPEGSLKTKTCIRGNKLLYEICEKNAVPYKKTGKLIIAKDASEFGALEELFEQGKTRGLDELKMLDKADIKKLEPNIKATRAIWLPMTGIVDSHSLMRHFLLKTKSLGGDIVYNSKVSAIKKVSGGYEVVINAGTNECSTFRARIVINSAGLESDTVSALAGIKKDEYALSYCKGDYFRLARGKKLETFRLVYPISKPDDTFLGIHITPDLAGGTRLGPDAEYLEGRNIDYSVDPSKRDIFYESTKTFLPFLEKKDLSIDTSGVRPKLQKDGEGFRDFVIKHEDDAGFEGFINLIGIESPGLTAAPAIAEKVKKQVNKLI